MKTSHRALNERFAFVVCKKQAEIKDPCIRSLICFVLFFLHFSKGISDGRKSTYTSTPEIKLNSMQTEASFSFFPFKQKINPHMDSKPTRKTN